MLMILGVHHYKNFDDGVNINKVILTLIIEQVFEFYILGPMLMCNFNG